LKTIFSILDKRSKSFNWLLSLIFLVFIALVDIATGDIISFEMFFVLPVVFASWYGSNKTNIVFATICTIIWFFSEILMGKFDINIESIFYEGVPHFVVFLGLAVLITNFRDVHRFEAIAADTDSLTGLLNKRGLYAELANELLRCIRYNRIFSLAYLDIDNFKNINDSLGHLAGDKLLIQVADCLKSSLRATDVISRIGGDEFICLLPESDGETAKKAIEKVRTILKNNMASNHWPVSFSVGLVTFEKLPYDIKEAIEIADTLMYSVKNHKKNDIAYQVWQDCD